METSEKSISLVTRLLNGEQVTCTVCGKGIYEPVNPKAKINHGFICDNCGAHFSWDPVVIVE